MFDERTFIAYKQNQWKDLSGIVERVKSVGLSRLPPADLNRLGSLYRRTSADLAYVRTQHATPELENYLNELVGESHGVLYVDEEQRSAMALIADFFATDLPGTLRRRMPFIAVSFLLTLFGTLLAYALVRQNPGNLNLFVPPAFRDSAEAWKQGFADNGTVSATNGALFSSELMTHNITVGIAAFAFGLTTVLPAYFMLDNGFIMGALIAVVQPTGNLKSFWPGILPHGVCELSAIFIAGGAGLLCGWALINPGDLTRRDALILNGKEAAKMMVATVPLLIVAGIIEGNVSHSSLPHFAKYTLAAVQFIALAFYIYGRPTETTEAVKA